MYNIRRKRGGVALPYPANAPIRKQDQWQVETESDKEALKELVYVVVGVLRSNPRISSPSRYTSSASSCHPC